MYASVVTDVLDVVPGVDVVEAVSVVPASVVTDVLDVVPGVDVVEAVSVVVTSFCSYRRARRSPWCRCCRGCLSCTSF